MTWFYKILCFHLALPVMAVNRAHKSFKLSQCLAIMCVQSQDEFCIQNLRVANETENQSILIYMYKSYG